MSVGSASSQTTTMTISGNGTLRAVYTEETAQLEDVHDVEAVSQTVTNNEVIPGDWVDVTVRNNGDVNESFYFRFYSNRVISLVGIQLDFLGDILSTFTIALLTPARGGNRCDSVCSAVHRLTIPLELV